MLFNSFAFFVFFPVVTVAYFASPHHWRWRLLLVASCTFYMYFIPKYILILFGLILVDYVAARLIEPARGRRRRWLLIASLIANIGVLAVFKYVNFLSDNLTALAQFLGWNYGLPSLSIVLPIGLSFHTFQAMSYTIEVYRGRQPAERHLGMYALYVLFYPQLVAGPIERPQSLLPQLHRVQVFDYARVTSGLRLMAWGLFKKAVVADRLAWVVNVVYQEPERFSGPVLVTATVCFAFQILNDFSGYSDIAVGSARVMGFELRRNFDSPYQAASTPEFWRRWHMSLSTWFRDYVFRPLLERGRRRLPADPPAHVTWAVYGAAVMVTFLLSGLWHGANWTYVVWGGLNGLFLMLSGPTAAWRDRVGWALGWRRARWTDRLVRTATTFGLVGVTWVFFRSRSIEEAWFVLRGMTSGWESLLSPAALSLAFSGVGLSVAAVGMGGALAVEITHAYHRRRNLSAWLQRQPWWTRWTVYYGGIASLYFLYANEGEFIYFQF